MEAPAFSVTPPCLLRRLKSHLSQCGHHRPRHSLTAPTIRMTADPPTPRPASSPPTALSSPPKPSNATAQAPTPSPRLAAFLRRAEEGDPLRALARAEASFAALKARALSAPNPPSIVSVSAQPALTPTPPAAFAVPHFDIVIAGGTLGIIYATALQARGWRVAVVERGRLLGRTQEWNISREELTTLVDNAVLSAEQLADIIVTECLTPARIAFASSPSRDASTHGQPDIRVSGVLNVGVAPDRLVAHARENFERLGGTLLELHTLQNVVVAPDVVQLQLRHQPPPQVAGALGAGGTGISAIEDDGDEGVMRVTARLLIDAMGAFSPIAEQTRGARAPDAVCITVGACLSASEGSWPCDRSPDLIYSFTPIDAERSTQYFWEAFPIDRDLSCRTTYMFAYGPCDPRRQTLTDALEDYLDLLPEYQGVDVDNADVKRVLFGFFPSYYKSAPTSIVFDRILPVGDAGGLQSPISFGGFGCCLRHLLRISRAVEEALRVEDDSLLQKQYLQTLQWYQPSLSVTGLFHRAMSVHPGQRTAGPLLDSYGINKVLMSNMQAMKKLGRSVQIPFLRDIVTAPGLSKTLAFMALSNPVLAVRMTAFLGPAELIEWSGHYFALLMFAVLLPAVSSINRSVQNSGTFNAQQKFWWNRFEDATTYGSGADAREE